MHYWDPVCARNHIRILVLTTGYLWIAALRPVLLYRLSAVHVTKKDQSALDKTQSRLLKTALGVSKLCRNTPLLDALRISL